MMANKLRKMFGDCNMEKLSALANDNGGKASRNLLNIFGSGVYPPFFGTS
jgi:hypothetical protein